MSALIGRREKSSFGRATDFVGDIIRGNILTDYRVDPYMAEIFRVVEVNKNQSLNGNHFSALEGCDEFYSYWSKLFYSLHELRRLKNNLTLKEADEWLQLLKSKFILPEETLAIMQHIRPIVEKMLAFDGVENANGMQLTSLGVEKLIAELRQRVGKNGHFFAKQVLFGDHNLMPQMSIPISVDSEAVSPEMLADKPILHSMFITAIHDAQVKLHNNNLNVLYPAKKGNTDRSPYFMLAQNPTLLN